MSRIQCLSTIKQQQLFFEYIYFEIKITIKRKPIFSLSGINSFSFNKLEFMVTEDVNDVTYKIFNGAFSYSWFGPKQVVDNVEQMNAKVFGTSFCRQVNFMKFTKKPPRCKSQIMSSLLTFEMDRFILMVVPSSDKGSFEVMLAFL